MVNAVKSDWSMGAADNVKIYFLKRNINDRMQYNYPTMSKGQSHREYGSDLNITHYYICLLHLIPRQVTKEGGGLV